MRIIIAVIFNIHYCFVIINVTEHFNGNRSKFQPERYFTTRKAVTILLPVAEAKGNHCYHGITNYYNDGQI